MSFGINANQDSLSILFNLSNINDQINKSLTRLSTGKRINTAADDPSGSIIATRFQVQIDSLSQAISSAQDSANLVKTASSGLSEISSLLSTIRTSALNAAANVTTNPTAAQASQLSIQNAIASITSIAASTSYGNKALLDGSAGTFASVTDSSLVGGISINGYFGGGVTQAGSVTLSVINAATTAQAGGGAGATYSSVNATLSSVNGGTTGAGGTVTLNGQSLTVSGSDTVQTLINKINAISASTGVSANASTANGSTSILLTQANYGTNYKITVAESSALVVGTVGTSVAGTNATVTLTAQTLVGGAVTTTLVTFVGGRGAYDSGVKLTDTYGNSILLTDGGNNTANTNRKVASVTANALSFQVGANAGQTASLTFNAVGPSSLGNTSFSGQNLSTIDVTTASGASQALTIIDEAIGQVSRYNAQLGSFQKNVLEVSSNVLSVAKENLSAALSRIEDTDVAEETMRLTKLQTIQQAGLSALYNSQKTAAAYLRLLS